MSEVFVALPEGAGRGMELRCRALPFVGLTSTGRQGGVDFSPSKDGSLEPKHMACNISRQVKSGD